MKTFVVLGMHRSATSLIAKGLNENNVAMGKVLIGRDKSNMQGHFEDAAFVALNAEILKKAGGTWKKPPQEVAILMAGKDMASVIKDTVEKAKREPYWGWKDPRTTLTVKCYLPYLTNPHFISCFREPIEVARSLNKRDGMPISEGVKLCKTYNNRLLQFLYAWQNNGYKQN